MGEGEKFSILKDLSNQGGLSSLPNHYFKLMLMLCIAQPYVCNAPCAHSGLEEAQI